MKYYVAIFKKYIIFHLQIHSVKAELLFHLAHTG